MREELALLVVWSPLREKIEQTPEDVVLRLGSRRFIEEAFRELHPRIDRV